MVPLAAESDPWAQPPAQNRNQSPPEPRAPTGRECRIPMLPSERLGERVGLIWSDRVNYCESVDCLSLFLLFSENRASSSLGRF
jgi:hypothetical protein